jgi:hypothetical protein
MKTSKLSIGLVTVAIVMVAASSFAGGPPPQVSAPEAGSTALLMSFAVAGLTAIKRFMR